MRSIDRRVWNNSMMPREIRLSLTSSHDQTQQNPSWDVAPLTGLHIAPP